MTYDTRSNVTEVISTSIIHLEYYVFEILRSYPTCSKSIRSRISRNLGLEIYIQELELQRNTEDNMIAQAVVERTVALTNSLKISRTGDVRRGFISAWIGSSPNELPFPCWTPTRTRGLWQVSIHGKHQYPRDIDLLRSSPTTSLALPK